MLRDFLAVLVALAILPGLIYLLVDVASGRFFARKLEYHKKLLRQLEEKQNAEEER